MLKTLAEVACGAKRNLAFDLFGAKRVGAVNFARTKAMINAIGGITDGGGTVFFCLIERKLEVWCGLKFVERDAGDAGRVR